MPSIGKDLAKIRAHLGLSIHDIQNATKIPVSTLATIENDTIFSRHQEGTTYIRSFVRSYGRALKVDNDIMIKALDQHEVGNYNDLLLQQFPGLSERRQPEPPSPADEPVEPSPPSPPIIEEVPQKGDNPELFPPPKGEPLPKKEPETAATTETEAETKTAKPDAKAAITDTGGKEEVQKESPKKPEQKQTSAAATAKQTGNTPPGRNVDWADMGKKFSDDKKHFPSWLIGLLILLIVAAGTAFALYYFGYLDINNGASEQTTPQNQTTQSGLSLDFEDPSDIPNETTASATAAAELDETLYITVYAAYDKLDPVRVWSDLKPRLDPYWMEQGVALQFEFRDTVQVRGPYTNLLLFMNGHLIHDFYDNHYLEENDVVELTRDFFSGDAKWASEISLELPEDAAEPDSLSLRPVFSNF